MSLPQTFLQSACPAINPDHKEKMNPLTEPYIGRYWRKTDSGQILCYLCPRNCLMKEGQRGFCFVRQNIKGQLVLTTYGRSSGFCVDPIEKKPLNHFFPGTSILSFGTAGCNLGCKFCQNWDLSRSKQFDRMTEQASPEMIAKRAKEMGVPSVAFTYNDPVVFAEYAMDVAKACHDEGIYTVAVTAGYISDEARADFFEHMDAANVDLKAFTEDFYKRLALGSLQPVLDTLIDLKERTKVWFEITNLVIPGENDSHEEIHAMTEWISKNLGPDVPLHFTAFHPDFKMREYPSTPAKTLSVARSIALSKGLKYVYTGNICDQEGASTYCHQCGKILIQRECYELGEYHIKDGKCTYCGAVCAGCFQNEIGKWGGQRQPITFK